jgi:hypothetical protein
LLINPAAPALENQLHNDNLRHAQTVKSDRLLATFDCQI